MNNEEISKIVNKILAKNNYFNILCIDDYPLFTNKYLRTLLLKRISKIDQFCGQFYNGLEFFNMLYEYSRLDHSIACACIIWKLTKDKTQTLLALFHDCGTPDFSHTIDFMLGDSKNQESSEKDIYELMKNDDEILHLLKVDNVDINDFKDLRKFTLVENKAPKLCVDRLEGVFHTCLIWRKIWNLDDIKEISNHLVIGTNEEDNKEISFDSVDVANNFIIGMKEYAISLQKNDDKLSLSFLGDILKLAINYHIISYEDFFLFSEEEIINKIKLSGNMQVNSLWNSFVNLKNIYRSEEFNKDMYCKSLESKKRYVNPLVKINNDYIRLTEISEFARQVITEYLEFKDSKYAYFEIDAQKVKIK